MEINIVRKHLSAVKGGRFAKLCEPATIFAIVLRTAIGFQKPCAIIAGGETVVKVKGTGKGGRNQEVVLAAALKLDGFNDVVMFSLGSDGTDGPTDAAGGMVDGESIKRMKSGNIDPISHLENNNAYYALQSSNDLIMTGATGMNVNDVIVLL